MTPEGKEQAAIIKLTRQLGGDVYVLGHARRAGDYQGTMQTPGLPDLWIFLPDGAKRISLAFEVKTSKGRMSLAQKTFQVNCELADIPHLVGGLDRYLAWLRDLGYVR